MSSFAPNRDAAPNPILPGDAATTAACNDAKNAELPSAVAVLIQFGFEGREQCLYFGAGGDAELVHQLEQLFETVELEQRLMGG